jgi:hypothetical protein
MPFHCTWLQKSLFFLVVAAPLLTVFTKPGCGATARLENAILEEKQLTAQAQFQSLSDKPPAGFRVPPNLKTQGAQWTTFHLAGRPFVCAFLSGRKALVDANGNSTFDADEIASPLTALPAKSEAPQRFSPANFQLPGAPPGDIYPATLEVRFVTSWTLQGTRSEWRASLQSATRREGRIEAAGRTMRCALQDANSNGRFDDPFQIVNGIGDRLFLDLNGDDAFSADRESLFFGHFAAIGTQLFAVTVAPGGSTLSLNVFSGQSGAVQTEEAVSTLEVAGDAGYLAVSIEGGRASLPVGEWLLLRWTAKQKWEGRDWILKAAPRHPPTLRIGAAPLSHKLISPIVPVLDADRQNEGLRFTLNLTTESGDVVLALEPENAPGYFQRNFQLRLLDEQSQPWARLRLTPEGDATYSQFWQPPVGAPSRLGVRPELDAGPFQIAETPPLDLIVPRTTTP